MKRFLVADDLTGASDAGVQYAKRELRTTVWLDYTAPLDSVDADVVVLDMDSRAIAAGDAYGRMRSLLAELRPATPRAIVKKMDSTLRGNPGPETRALLEELPDALAVVCPAYPKNGRTSRNGILAVAGTPVDRTDFGRDLFTPVRDAHIAAHFPDESVLLDLETVREGTAALDRKITSARERGVRIAIADAEINDDLRAIAALNSTRDDLLWVASAGLIEVLDGEGVLDTAIAAVPPAKGPVVFLVGSISAMTERQVAYFAAHGGVTELIDPLDLLEGAPAVAGSVLRALAAVNRGDDVLVALRGERQRVDAALHEGVELGWDALTTSYRMRERFVAATEPLVSGRPGATVVLSGGDIARAFCDANGVRGMTLIAEAAPGIPISRAIGADLFLVTKAGGFGTPSTYRDIVATLHAQVTA